MGVLVFETDETYNFAEQCIKKEFERIFLKKSSTLTTEERMFFEQTDFKVLILGADSDYAVQSFKGYSYFLNLIYNSQFTQYSYGVPIMCSFSYANSHGLVETEFVNTVYIEPLYVDVTRENSSSYDERNYSSSMYLNFYHDRAKTKPAIPATDIIFTVNKYESTCQYYPDYQHWPMIKIDCTDKQETLNIRNISFKSRIFVGTNRTWYESTGPMPSGKPSEPVYTWSAREEHCLYTLSSSPFYIII